MPNPAPLPSLGDIFLFREWSADDLVRLQRLGRVTRRARGDILFMQDDPCPDLYVLLSGRVQMFRTTPDGREVTLHVVQGEALVACAALFLDRSFPASARVVSDEAVVAVVGGRGFLELLASRPELARRMIAALAMRIGELAARIESQSAGSAHSRLVAWLLEQPSRLGAGHERIVRLEARKKALAAALGITPETLSRTLRRLAQDGLIRVEGREIVILDPAKLMQAGEG